MKSGRNHDELALHSLRIGGATTLAEGRGVSEQVIQKKERWKSDAYKTLRVITWRDRDGCPVPSTWQSKRRRCSLKNEQYGVEDDN